MSPEQTHGQKLDHRSDLFSLGIVMYQLLAGRHPFSAENVQGVVTRLRRGDYQQLSRRRPDLPAPLTWLVDRMLSVNPDDRPPYGQAVVSGINEVAKTLGLELRAEGLANLLGSLFPDQSQVRPSTPPESFFFVEQAGTPSQPTDEAKTLLSPGLPAAYQAEHASMSEDPSSHARVEVLEMDRGMHRGIHRAPLETAPTHWLLRNTTLIVLAILIAAAVVISLYLSLEPMLGA
jgi:serine/threonine protein kinase